MTTKQKHIILYPWRLFRALLAWIGFGLNIIGIVLTAAIYFLICGKGQKQELWLHRTIQRCIMFPIRMSYGVKAIFNNPNNEDFSRQAVITCNHQSMFDILMCLSLTDKLVVLTKSAYSHNPFFAPLFRLADFIPLRTDNEEWYHILTKKIEQGYSVLVYPEGTRTRTGLLGKFHSGAYFIAHKYKLDILPLIIHGSFDVMPKGQFVPNIGTITLDIQKRVSADDLSFGNNYRQRTIAFQNYYAQQLNNTTI